jgi:hypothetical protein
MRGIWLLASAVVCSATAAMAQASVDWMNKETTMWQAVKDKKIDAFSAGLDSTFVGVYTDGLHNRDTEVAQVRPTNLKDFHLSDFTVHRLSPQVVLLTYKVVVNGESGGKDLSGAYWVASVWQKRGQQWRTVMHTEEKAL